MPGFNTLIIASLLYITMLFVIAFIADRGARQGKMRWIRSPWIYTLSLSIYCTAWTFYGAVGYAARSGLEFLTIYLGPSLVMFGWWGLLRKLVRVGRAERITSIADLISARFGKSFTLGVIVTLIAVIATTPYIALQLQSISQALGVFSEASGREWAQEDTFTAGFWLAIGLGVFTVAFGTRNVEVNERQHGIVLAIAVEAIVKLVALFTVGMFVVWVVAGGVGPTLDAIAASPIAQTSIDGGRWIGVTFVSAMAFVTLPRMFQVIVVENESETHLLTASWAFPLYLLLMSMFVVPIAAIGFSQMPESANSDLYVLSLPLQYERTGLAVLSFLGGFSSATSMVIVSTLALATMLSNNIFLPIWFRAQQRSRAVISGDVGQVVMLARRLLIVFVLLVGYLYFRLSEGGALAAIGLVSFAGAAQVFPAMIGGLYWRGATRYGAMAGLIIGVAIWSWTLFLPSFGSGEVITLSAMENGPFGVDWLRPRAFMGVESLDPFVNAVMWSLGLNMVAFFIVSVLTFPTVIERLQGAQMVNIFTSQQSELNVASSHVPVDDLLAMSQRILGAEAAQTFFLNEARKQGSEARLPTPTVAFLETLERRLTNAVGAATAHAMIGQVAQRAVVSFEDLIAVADETAQMKEHSHQLESQSRALKKTAEELRATNAKLQALSEQKDAFLGQISHELRTPMTSILSFSDILLSGDADPESTRRFSRIINDEATRLTRLLDDLLDLNVLEAGRATLNLTKVELSEILDRAEAVAGGQTLRVQRVGSGAPVWLTTDADRLLQVFVNLISNAAKYGDETAPVVQIITRAHGDTVIIDFIDNGAGVPHEEQEVIFEKFARLDAHTGAAGAGLGLAICREIAHRLGGWIAYVPEDMRAQIGRPRVRQSGAWFRVSLPLEGPDQSERVA